MTYRQEMQKLCKALVQLVQDGGAVPPQDVRLALTGHSALIELIKRLDTDLGLESPQALVFARQLARQPVIADQTLIEALARPAASSTGRLWAAVAKAATVAQHDWETADRATRPRGELVRVEAADVGALAEAAAVLNGDVADSLAASSRGLAAADFYGAQAPLLVAARSLRSSLTSHAVHGAMADLRPGSYDAVLVRLRPNQLAEGWHRLTRLIASTEVAPGHIDRIAAGIPEQPFRRPRRCSRRRGPRRANSSNTPAAWRPPPDTHAA